jgi:polyhydroxybutyrate depolymerase
MWLERGWRSRLVVLLMLAGAAPAAGDELDLITAALFGQLNRTATFDTNDDDDVSVADLTAQAEAGEPGSAGCGQVPPAAGRQTIDVDSVTRRYLVRPPATYDSHRPHPVVFGFHGFTGSAAGEEQVAKLVAQWPDAIGVYGEGLRRTFPGFGGIEGQGWQVFPGESGDRDVRFFDAMLARLASEYCINPRRVYVTGHSNGAFFSHVLACTRGATIAAIGPMAGGVLGCRGTDPVAVLISHGSADNVVPFSIGTAARSSWIQQNACSSERVPYANACEINPDCAGDRQVAFCRFAGTHAPDPMFPANMFRFFREHAL